MASPHPTYPNPGPSSYYHNAPPPPQFYGNGPAPAPYYNPYMPPMNGHPPMHQPASPRMNSPSRGRYLPQSQRGGMPNYQHYPPIAPPPHNLHPGANMQSPPISPINPYTHPHATKYPPPHVPHVPYSPTYHPQPNGGYQPGWSQLPTLPKQLSMLSPTTRSPVPVPALSLQQELTEQDVFHVQIIPAQQPVSLTLQHPPEEPSVSQQPLSTAVEHRPVQLVGEPAGTTALTASARTGAIAPEEAVSVEAQSVPQTTRYEFLSEGEQDDGSEVTRSVSSGTANGLSMSSSELFGWVIWSRRPQDPSHAPGVIIATRAFPPDHVVDGAFDLPTPPLSPSIPFVKLVPVEPSVPEMQNAAETASMSPDEVEVPSSSVTESTPASSTPGETPVPGSPATSRTSVSLPVTSPTPGKNIDVPGAAEEPKAVMLVPIISSTETPVSDSAASPTVPLQPSEAQQTAAPMTVPAKPVVKRSWASLLQSGDATASSSKSRLPTSSVVGFSIPAAGMPGSSTGPSAVTGIAGVPHRHELLKLISNGPPLSNIPPKIQPRGLINTGNMCFANAVLQILVYCQPFNRLFGELSKYLTGPALGSQKEGSKATPLVDAIIQFMKEFAPAAPADVKAKGKERDDFYEPEAFIPSYVYDAMKEKKRFASMIGGHQEDAEEFLGFFLDTLEEELLSLSSPAPNAPKPSEEADVTAQDDGWYEVGKKNRAMITRTVKSTESSITRIFGGKFRSILRAPHQKDSVTLEDWRSLRLDIQRDTVHTIKDALQSISQPQPVQISQPTRPGVVVEATQQVLIELLPPVLVLHLKRFHYDTNVGDVVKIGKQVSYGPELDISADLLAPAKRTAQPVKYQLFGVLYHHGQSASGGHYTLDVLHPNRDLTDRPRAAWIRIDDELVSDIRPDDVFGGVEQNERCAYLLFYRRLGAWGPART